MKFKFALTLVVSLGLFTSITKAQQVASGGGQPVNGTATPYYNSFEATGGVYLLKGSTGPEGPWLARQCLLFTDIDEKRQCQYNNLTDSIDRSFSRLSAATIKFNNQALFSGNFISSTIPYMERPITLTAGTKNIEWKVSGYPSAFGQYSIEPMPPGVLMPRALFTVSKMTCVAPCEISFNASQSFDPNGGTLTYDWTWGDGTTNGNIKQPKHTYQNAGTYEAKLVVAKSTGETDELPVTFVIKPQPPTTNPPANLKPTALITATYPDPNNKRKVHFSSAGSLDPDGLIVKYLWTFGDGTTSTESEVDHVFPQDSTYFTTLKTVDDDNGTAMGYLPTRIWTRPETVSFGPVYVGPTQYGPTGSSITYEDSFAVDPAILGSNFKLVFTNADGQDHTAKDCNPFSGPERVLCNYDNLVNQTYRNTMRMTNVYIYVNGLRVNLNAEISANVAVFTTPIALKEINTIKVQYSGWPTTYGQISVVRYETNIPPVADFTVQQINNTMPRNIVIDASTSHDDNDSISKWRFVLSNGVDSGYLEQNFFEASIEEFGNYTATVYVKDQNDAVHSATKAFEVAYRDSTVPVATTNVPDNSFTNQANVSIHIEDESAVTTNVFRNNAGAPFATFTTKDFDVALIDGVNNLRLRMTDALENISEQYFTFSRDTQAATITTPLSYVPIESFPGSATVAFNSNEPLQSISINGTPVTPTGLTASYNFNISEPAIYRFNVVAYDFAGNQTQTYFDVNFVQADHDAPVISTSLASGTFVNSQSLTVSVSDANSVTTTIKRNGALLTSSSQISIPITLLTGLNTIEINSGDIQGNQSSKTITVTFDETAPTLTLLSSNVFATQSNPADFIADFLANEDITEALINGSPATITGRGFKYTFHRTSSGTETLAVQIKDRAGNTFAKSFNFEFSLDSTAPVITIGTEVPTPTNKTSFVLPITIDDESTTNTKIIHNGVTLFQTGSKSFNANIAFDHEGSNQIKVQSSDIAGNVAVEKVIMYIRDTVPPILSNLVPVNGAVQSAMAFVVSGKANESLTEVYVNGLKLDLAANKQNFSKDYVASGQGTLEFLWEAKDLAGNMTTVHTSNVIQVPLLSANLLSVSLAPGGQGLVIFGQAGAVRPGATVSASAGFFGLNSGSTTAAGNGSFQILMDYFDDANVTVTDTSSGATQTTTVHYDSTTKLSGVVKDVDGNPLPGVTLKVGNSTVFTDGIGAFSFNQPPTGDQTLEIDGSSVPQSVTGPTRSFPKTKVSVNVGFGQLNALEVPIYLTPLLQDGTQTPIVQNQTAVVVSEHAPGVTISIPANKTQFPSGSTSGEINMMTIPAERATVPAPASMQPTKIVSLEPSGTKFTERVELTLPNDSELPVGTDMVVMSMNSSKGSWEVDGVATVESAGTIKTKPGRGISHFSLVYAVPVSPVLYGMKDPSKLGIDVSKDSMTTKVDLPSMKVLGAEIGQSLVYKSSWAKPTAYVSNMIDVPEMKISASTSATTTGVAFNQLNVQYGCSEIRPTQLCRNVLLDLWDHYRDTNTVSVTSYYQPTSISAQYFVSSLHTESTEVVSAPTSTTNPTIDGPIYGGKVMSSIVKLTPEGNLPNQSVVSFAVPLQNSDNGNFLESGIYPSLAHYEIKLKNIIMKSVSVSRSTDRAVGINGQTIQTFTNILGSAGSTTTEQNIVNKFLPHDVTNDLLVQNKIGSSAGRGWHLVGPQRIVNPSGSKLMVEESNGEVTTYALANTMSNRLIGYLDLRNGVGFEGATQIVPTMFNDGNFDVDFGQGFFVRSNPSYNFAGQANTSVSPTIGQHYPRIGSQAVYRLDSTQCSVTPNSSTGLKVYSSAMSYRPKFGQFVTLPNGTIYATDQGNHAILKLAAGGDENTLTSRLAGKQKAFGYMTSTLDKSGYEQIGFKFKDNPTPQQMPCSTIRSNYNSKVGTEDLKIGLADFAGDNLVGAFESNPDAIAFNSPTGIAISPQGELVVADTGNNRVRAINLQTKTVRTIAGKGGNSEAVTSGAALDIDIYHPQSLAFDPSGALYIGTENGYILRLSPEGYVSHIAGKSISNGGMVSNEAPMAEMAFNNIAGLLMDSVNSYLYASDAGYNRVLRLDLVTGTSSIIAGTTVCESPTQNVLDPTPDPQNQAALNVSLCSPGLLGFDEANNLLVVDRGHNQIRKVNLTSGNSLGISRFLPSNQDGSRLERDISGAWKRYYRNGNVADFNAQGMQTFGRDRVGNTTSYTYDSNKNLTRTDLPGGAYFNYGYSSGKLSNIQDSAGKTTNFNYDADGQLKVVSYSDGTQKSFEYGSDKLMKRESNQRGKFISYEYNSFGRLSKLTREDGSLAKVDEEMSASLEATVQGQAKNQNIATGVSTALTDGKGNRTRILTNYSNQVTHVNDSSGGVTQILRDRSGRPTLVRKPAGDSVSYYYDPTNGDLTLKRVYGQNPETDYLDETFVFNSFGQIVQKVDQGGKTYSFEYYPTTGLLKKKTLPGGRYVEFTYNTKGLVLTKTLHPNASSSLVYEYTYDSKGNATRIQGPGGSDVSQNFDSSGNVLSSSVKRNSTTVLTSNYTYDAFNRLKSVRTPKNELTQYFYDQVGNLTRIVDALGKETTFEYNDRNKMIKKVASNGATTTASFDEVGNLTRFVDPNGNIKTYLYDSGNRVSEIASADDLVNYAYDENGDISNVRNSVSSISYSKDEYGRPKTVVFGGLLTEQSFPVSNLEFSYDESGNRTALNTNIGSWTYQYDNLDRPTQITNFKNEIYSFNYDDIGRVSNILRPGTSTSFNYSGAGDLASIEHSNSSGVISSASYTYDLSKLVSSVTSGSSNTSYSYDSNGQLIGVNSNNGAAESFTYDGNGNRTSDQNGIFSYDQNAQRLTEDWQYTYSYDLNGNLLFKNPKNITMKAYQYIYSSKNQLIEARTLSSALGAIEKKVSFKYDVIGRRMVKKVEDYAAMTSSTQKYHYDGYNLIAVFDEGNNLLIRYTHSPLGADDILSADVTSYGVSAGVATQEGSYQYLKDRIGSVSSIVRNNGLIVQNYEYSGFGSISKITNANGTSITSNPYFKNSFTFTGREFDQETDLYYYRARYYDPRIGRFIQEDPHPGHLENPMTISNKFQYCGNNPISNRDPSGMDFDPIGALIDLGHNLIASFGSQFDTFIKSDGFKNLVAVVATFVVGWLIGPAALIAGAIQVYQIAYWVIINSMKGIALRAVFAGINSYFRGNRSLAAFEDGAKKYVNNPDGVRTGALMGIAGGLVNYGTDWGIENYPDLIDQESVSFVGGVFLGNSTLEAIKSDGYGGSLDQQVAGWGAAFWLSYQF